MTNSSNDRLDRIEALVASNARAIEALSSQQSEAAEERQELREATLRAIDLAEGIANLTASLDTDRLTILGRLSRIENKVDRLLGNPDRNNS